VIATFDCEKVKESDARLVKPPGAEAAALVLLGATGELRDEKGKTLPDLIGRVPDRLCLASAGEQGEAVTLTYRAVGPFHGLFAPKLFHLVGDAGSIVEATAASSKPDRVVLLHHGIGELTASALFQGSPSMSQIQRSVRPGAFPLLARAVLKPEGGTEISLDCSATAEGCRKTSPKP
jgi:hypothetical protein